MIYTHNNKTYNIKDSTLKDYMNKLSISIDEAIELYLFDNDIVDNEEVIALSKQAKENKSLLKVGRETKPKEPTIPKVGAKATPQKENIINFLANNLNAIATDIVVVNKGKIITFKVEGIAYKLDLTQTRGGKK